MCLHLLVNSVMFFKSIFRTEKALMQLNLSDGIKWIKPTQITPLMFLIYVFKKNKCEWWNHLSEWLELALGTLQSLKSVISNLPGNRALHENTAGSYIESNTTFDPKCTFTFALHKICVQLITFEFLNFLFLGKVTESTSTRQKNNLLNRIYF